MRKKRREGKGESPVGDTGRPRITPIEVQQKEFRLAFRGYNERDVDAFLDEITEEIGLLLEENQRLRRGVPAGGPAGSSTAVDEARREAEDIVARAREEAAAILREAEARAAVAGMGGPDAQAISPFIRKEREFLQSLAGLIQGHAESVKEMVRLARESRPTQAQGSSWEAVVEAANRPAPVGTPILGADRVTIVEEPEAEAEEEPEVEVAAEPEAAGDAEETAPAAGGAGSAPVGAEQAGPSEGPDPSLRELFWGED